MAGKRCSIMEIVADLYVHSTCSDEQYLPGILLKKVIKAGLSTFAFSNHDTIDHIPIINDY
jgi:predicted metal-dependent phosphoesterase TrpH